VKSEPDFLPRPWAVTLGRLRERFGPRTTGLALALGIEALLVAILLTLGWNVANPPEGGASLVSFDVDSDASQAEDEAVPAETAGTIERVAEMQDDVPQPVEEERPQDVEPPQRQIALIPLSRDQMASTDIAAMKPPANRAPVGPAFGPAGSASPGDSEVVGTAPDGEPLYAARWYREPSPSELRGYLETANQAGWALIACRTASQWRVEDCVGLGEYPQGSQLERAVLAAAWQFQVRPPRRGGQSLVGSWVRIRITYTTG